MTTADTKHDDDAGGGGETAPALPTPPGVEQVRTLFESAAPLFAEVLPRTLTVERLVRIGLTAVQRQSGLLSCDRLSLVAAMMECATLGLEPDGVLGHAYLVPFWNGRTRRREVQFIAGYKGLIALARRSPEVASVYAQVVREGDLFEYEYGTQKFLKHRFADGERGAPKYAYALVTYRSGQSEFEVMPWSQVQEIRQRALDKNKRKKDDPDRGPWVTDEDEMARKTAIRRLSKYLPLSTQFQRAAALDELHEIGKAQQLAALLDPAHPVTRMAMAQQPEPAPEGEQRKKIAAPKAAKEPPAPTTQDGDAEYLSRPLVLALSKRWREAGHSDEDARAWLRAAYDITDMNRIPAALKQELLTRAANTAPFDLSTSKGGDGSGEDDDA